MLAGLGADAVGVDIDKSNAPFWKDRQLNCILADGRYLPFKKHSFDCVIAIEVIEHIGQEKKGMLRKAERKRFVDELKRVCRRQGAIFLSTPNQKFPIDIAHAGMSRSIIGGLSIGGIRFHTPWESFTLSLQDLKKLFEEMPIELVSPLNYVNWNWEFFTRHKLIKYVVFPIGRLLVKLLDKLPLLRATPINPHLIVVIKAI